ncbi:MAG: OmpA family protein [Bacteroidetes bacterium]|nr:MAG: OmpA family protein [Bacteroidota bacterium]
MSVTAPHATSWDAGLVLGAANAYGDLVANRSIQFKQTNLASGGFVRYHATRHLSLRASYLRAKLAADDADWTSLAGRGLRFESTLNELALIGQWHFGAPAARDSNGVRRAVRPFIFAGFGVGLTDSRPDYSNILGNARQEELVARDIANTKSSHFVVPMGIGLSIDLSDQLLLTLDYGLRPVFNDYLDGVSETGNPDRNDWYSLATAGLAYRMGEGSNKDQDQDGIADFEDRCPEQAGTAQNLGCPDSDADGVVDHLDACPTLAGDFAAGGCPDADGDGVADGDDKCPGVPGSKTAQGCADSDGDGVADSEDRCSTVPGLAKFKGCRDTDNDGVADPDDRCPYEKGEAATAGCPPPTDPKDPSLDSDGDGVPNSEDDCPFLPGKPELKGCQDGDGDGVADHVDRCPYEKGTAAYQGCPPSADSVEMDTDGDGLVDKDDPCPEIAGTLGGCPDTDADGLADHVDQCPTVAGPESRQGCPELSNADMQVLEAAVDNVSFQQGSYNLISSSYATLDKIAQLMQQYPSYHLKIEGHTDNQGDSAANQRLSEARALACLNYLHERGGIDKSRMTYVGYGGEKPRAPNDSESGRRRNRRVEFVLFEPGQ